MKYNLSHPCHECPYVGNMPGWIGSHETAQDFVDLVKRGSPFPCHMTVNQNLRGAAFEEAAFNAEHCVGYLLFANRMLRLSCDRETAAAQIRLKKTCKDKVLWPPRKLVEHHAWGGQEKGDRDAG